METDLFGNPKILEENFEIIYQGSSFGDGKILLRSLYSELQSLEAIINDSISVLIKTGKLSNESKNFEIYIEINKGSVWEKVKVIFKNPGHVAIIAGIVVPFLNTTYQHFLDKTKPVEERFQQEISMVSDSPGFKNNLKNILAPVINGDDNISIKAENINITINYAEKSQIVQSLEETEEDKLLKNGEFEEVLIGTIRKLDLDAQGNNYFAFTIDNGPSRIPTGIKGEFSLNDYKDILDEPIKIKAVVRYKNGEIKHIQIESYELLNPRQPLPLGQYLT